MRLVASGPSAAAEASVPAVLIVEDDVMVRSIAAEYLRDGGLEVIEASNADEAVQLVTAGLNIGLVLSDVNMPGSMDGFGLARWLREHHPALRIILASGALRTTGQVETLADDLLLANPYHHEELIRRIREMLGR
jgi:CheY-like chemotaxis protein